MVTTHSGQLSWLITIRYSKIVVMETRIWASPDRKNTKFYRNVISPGWKMTEWTKNKWTESASILLTDIPLELQDSFKQTQDTFVQNMAVKNDPWKLIGWDIPSIKKKKMWCFQDKKIPYWQISVNWQQCRQQRISGKTYLCRQDPQNDTGLKSFW